MVVTKIRFRLDVGMRRSEGGENQRPKAVERMNELTLSLESEDQDHFPVLTVRLSYSDPAVHTNVY